MIIVFITPRYEQPHSFVLFINFYGQYIKFCSTRFIYPLAKYAGDVICMIVVSVTPHYNQPHSFILFINLYGHNIKFYQDLVITSKYVQQDYTMPRTKQCK